MSESSHVKYLVLDATPLITHSYSHYQNYATAFYTTPTVFNEIKDQHARKNLEIWQATGNFLLKHPSEASIKRVSDFAKLTGDYSVLSANDIHILALAYELEVELNKGDWRLRKKPGDCLEHLKISKQAKEVTTASVSTSSLKESQSPSGVAGGDEKEKKKRRRGGKRQKAKREAQLLASVETSSSVHVSTDSEVQKETTTEVEHSQDLQVSQSAEANDGGQDLSEEYDESDDNGDWITPENLVKNMIKDAGEDTVGDEGVEITEQISQNQIALATGDFAVQNVALQLNLNLMNFMSGLRIKRLRNYMLRCHACFKMYPLPKDGKQKHFCPSCGSVGTLLRCAVSVDVETGAITPHLKANFQWNNRGNRYSISSPLSKNSQKKYGKKGFVHTKQQQDQVILREDQKEYHQAMKQDEWTRRHNEKALNNWIGGGSVDNYCSPFAISGLKHHSVHVGRSRFINSSKKRA
ncbi:rRNA-binding endoribonuclease Ecym_5477 [Eremothecium cymbalariae DBVPG|uniref:20S-pre-rRNA D-site endonuclease NOB1 n=1 Tax=Eremothecium cymbalariae (strain CBS 270.75 / DBVPG 7215 / KCTC 17166 / NRRL Y-17582) TaxID=931890 RepID=I6NDT1_ERECY|nr:hypothetical protein Ecym_5477 [Eremothecium cymbalariae DBVPG\